MDFNSKFWRITKRLSAPVYAVLLIFIIFLIIKNDLSRIFSIDGIRTTVSSFGVYAALIFILIILFFTFFEFIPTFLLIILSGFIFGTLLGAVYSIIAMIIGSSVLFMIVRKFNKKFVKQEKKIKDLAYLQKLMKKDAVYAIYVARMVPVFPNELLVISAAFSGIKFKEFFLIMLIGLLPMAFIGAALGDSFTTPSFNLALIVFAFLGSIILSAFLFKDKIKAVLVHKTEKI